jgi:3-oxoacyl-[acyl-carrier-protein] synthase I
LKHGRKNGTSVNMKQVWVAADTLVSPLGSSSEENFAQLKKGVSGIVSLDDPSLTAVPVPAGKISSITASPALTRFEAMSLKAIEGITGKFSLPAGKTIFILSTTKGNISLIDEGRPDHPRLQLHTTAEFLSKKAGLKTHVVISNACISGVMALIVAKRFLQAEKYDHALVLGADTLSRFVISGFQSLQALSQERCMPFDADRRGINLGEAAAAMLLTTKPEALGVDPAVRILGAGLSNDANHISGPSRTGEELGFAIRRALAESSLSAADVDFISAHGTATRYNDEMEARAFNLAGLGSTPLNSLKAYYGHTLGAAGIVETVVSIRSLEQGITIPTLGFSTPGVSPPVNVIREATPGPYRIFLKTASGFGGCNAAMVLQKVN